MFSGIGGTEILVVLLFVLLLFGSKRIPEFARALGKAAREVRKAVKEIRDEMERTTPPEPPTAGSDKAG
jgi:sec-independent protein translocase protein TatA